MRAGVQRRDRLAVMLQHGLFARIHEHETSGQNQREELNQQQGGQIFLQRLEKPGFRNFEAELVIQRLRRRGEQTFRLRENAGDAAFVKRAGDFALHARTIDFQQQR